MTDIESRLRALAERSLPEHPTPDELRGRVARRRRRRRRMALGAVASVAIAGISLAMWRDGSEPRQQVSVDADASTTTTTPANEDEEVRTLGGVTGVTVDVTPSTGLRDGDLVEVTIEGLDELPEAFLGMCSGDVTASDPLASCDLGAVQNPATKEFQQVAATANQQVSVSRVLHTAGGGESNETRSYDCATEPAGCVLAVAPFELPARAVLVPLEFDDVSLTASATATLTPESGLGDGQEVTLRADGLTPNRVFRIGLCRTGPPACDGLDFMHATTDADGSLTTTVRVWAALYHYNGPVDCVSAGCTVVIFDSNEDRIMEVPYRFAEDVTAPEPELILEPDGPYSDGQDITVRGNEFRPGLDISGQIGQCPSDKDTSVEERCGYSLTGPVIVAEDGTFSSTFRLFDSLMFTGSCVTGPGCHLGWIIPHGTTLAKAPLTFTP
jgi:Neocarzinostatin family